MSRPIQYIVMIEFTILTVYQCDGQVHQSSYLIKMSLLILSRIQLTFDLKYVTCRTRHAFSAHEQCNIVEVISNNIIMLIYCRYSKPDFFYIKSWVPCIFFSGGVTMGTIGRALATVSNVL